jgi:hypothetical protein
MTPLAAVLPDNGDYVAAAYLVFVILLLIYLGIMSTKLGRLEKETTELLELAERQDVAPTKPDAERVTS